MLSDLEVPLVVRIQQVANLFLIDLSVRNLRKLMSANLMHQFGTAILTSTVKDSVSDVSACIRSKRASQMSGMMPRSAPYPIMVYDLPVKEWE